MQYISLVASLRQWLEAQPFPLKHRAHLQKRKGLVRILVSVKHGSAARLMGAPSLCLHWVQIGGPSSLMGYTIAAYLPSAGETERKSMRRAQKYEKDSESGQRACDYCMCCAFDVNKSWLLKDLSVL